jgi:hypothetical protein
MDHVITNCASKLNRHLSAGHMIFRVFTFDNLLKLYLEYECIDRHTLFQKGNETKFYINSFISFTLLPTIHRFLQQVLYKHPTI